MNTPAHHDLARAGILSRDEVADLLSRYPRVSDAEAKLIRAFLRKGRHLDVGMLTGDVAMKPHLDRFMADHGKHFRVGLFEGAAVTATIIGFLVALWLIGEVARAAG